MLVIGTHDEGDIVSDDERLTDERIKGILGGTRLAQCVLTGGTRRYAETVAEFNGNTTALVAALATLYGGLAQLHAEATDVTPFDVLREGAASALATLGAGPDDPKLANL